MDEAGGPGPAAPLVADGPIGDAVDPRQGHVGLERVVEAPPHRRVDLRDHVVDVVSSGYAPEAVGVDGSEGLPVQRIEPLFLGGTRGQLLTPFSCRSPLERVSCQMMYTDDTSLFQDPEMTASTSQAWVR